MFRHYVHMNKAEDKKINFLKSSSADSSLVTCLLLSKSCDNSNEAKFKRRNGSLCQFDMLL